MLTKLKGTVEYHAHRAVRSCNSLEKDDVIQTLYVKALTVRDKYDNKRSGEKTFMSRCFNNTVVDLQRDEVKDNENVFYTDFSNLELSYNPMREVNARLDLDAIEDALQGQKGAKMRNALKVFKKLRLGWTQKDCVEVFKWSKGYVSRLFNECIVPVGRAALG